MVKVTITTKSYTAIASGGGAGIIDSDVIYDNFGIPFIPAKRLKGLLRDSALEIVNLVQIRNGNNLIEDIFGAEQKQGKAIFENAYVEKYQSIKTEILALKTDKNFKNFLTRSNILSFYTTTRQQTAIDDNGIAKEHSLRTIRVLKPNIKFEAIIDDSDLSEPAKAVLYLAIKNFRRLGLNRNVGFGLIECNPVFENIDNKNVLNILQTTGCQEETHPNVTENKLIKFNYKSDNFSTKFLKVTTLSPVLLSYVTGDINTTETRLCIPGTTLRGVIAKKIIKELGLNESNAHENPLFKACFIENKLKINFAYPSIDNKIFIPFPQNFQSEKNYRNICFDIFNKEKEGTKTNAGFVLIDGSSDQIFKTNILTRAYFHGTRDDRKGKNTDGAIFYYDTIEPGTEFVATISAPDYILNELQNILGYSFEDRIGRSKTSQYGKAKFELTDNDDNETIDYIGEDTITLVALSPMILFNMNGMSEPSVELLKDYLKNKIPAEFEIKNQVCRVTKIDYFNSQWGCKSQTYRAYNEGSAFQIVFSAFIDNDLPNILLEIEKKGIGEFTYLGYGKIKFLKTFDSQRGIHEYKRKTNGSNQPKYTIEILHKILDEKYKIITEHLGRENVKKYKKISSSLCGRLIDVLQKFESRSDFINRFIKDENEGIKGKEAEKQLDEAFILESLNREYDYLYNNAYQSCNSIKSKIGYEPDKEKLYKYYWISFFKQMRLENKKKN